MLLIHCTYSQSSVCDRVYRLMHHKLSFIDVYFSSSPSSTRSTAHKWNYTNAFRAFEPKKTTIMCSFVDRFFLFFVLSLVFRCLFSSNLLRVADMFFSFFCYHQELIILSHLWYLVAYKSCLLFYRSIENFQQKSVC